MLLALARRSRHNWGVALRNLIPLKELLPSVLAQVARDTGRARQLKPIWDDAVGPTIARCATPLSLEGKTLVVSVASPHWATELQGREKELRDRLTKVLGKGAVTLLRFRIAG
jgi:predicted nucleic acid-binding Zn ribbon protein